MEVSGAGQARNLFEFNLDGSMTCTAGQVAQLLGLTETTFNRRRGDLDAANFPGKLPGINKWSRPAVIAWIRSNGATSTPIANGDAEIDRLTDALEARYAERAA